MRFENAPRKTCEKLCFENALEKMRKHVKKCEKMWKNASKMRKKCEQNAKNVKKRFENPVGKVELWFLLLQVWFFWVPVLLQLLCCLPNFCRLKIGEEQFKSIGSGLSADLLNLAIAKQWLPGAKHKRTKPQNCFKKYIFSHFSHFFAFLKCIFSHFLKLHFWITFFSIFSHFSHFFTFLIDHCFQACSWKRPG